MQPAASSTGLLTVLGVSQRQQRGRGAQVTGACVAARHSSQRARQAPAPFVFVVARQALQGVQPRGATVKPAVGEVGRAGLGQTHSSAPREASSQASAGCAKSGPALLS